MWFLEITNSIALKAFLCIAVLGSAGHLYASGKADTALGKEYFEIAQAYTEIKKYDKAAEFYRKAARDPAHKNAAEYNLARIYGLQGNWISAVQILQTQHTAAPENTVILDALAYSLAATGEYTQAAALYKAVYEKDTENPAAAFNYARIMIVASRYDDAAAFLEGIAPAFPENNEKKTIDELQKEIEKARKKSADTAPENDTKTGTNSDSTSKNISSADSKTATAVSAQHKAGKTTGSSTVKVNTNSSKKTPSGETSPAAK